MAAEFTIVAGQLAPFECAGYLRGTFGELRSASAFGAGFSRTEFASYLPAFFVAGAMCLVAAMLVLTIAKRTTQGAVGATPAPARG